MDLCDLFFSAQHVIVFKLLYQFWEVQIMVVIKTDDEMHKSVVVKAYYADTRGCTLICAGMVTYTCTILFFIYDTQNGICCNSRP